MTAEFCRCGEELATVTVSTADGSVKVGKRCAGLLEMLWALLPDELGQTRRRPNVQVIRGSVE